MRTMWRTGCAAAAGILTVAASGVVFVFVSLRAALVAAGAVPLLAGGALGVFADGFGPKDVGVLAVGPVLGFGGLALVNGSITAVLLLAVSAGGAVAGARGASLLADSAPYRAGAVVTTYLGACVLALTLGLPASVSEDYFRRVDQPLPAFTVRTLQGDRVDGSDLEGKVAVLDFWTTWCGPCIRQFPAYERLRKQYAENSDVYVAAVNTSWRNSMEDARSFAERRALGLPVLYDREGTLTEKLGIRSIPHTVIVGPDGRVRFRHSGFLNVRSVDPTVILSRHVDRLLPEENRSGSG